MGLDENLDFDYKNLLNIFGEFRGFKELLKLDELLKRIDRFDLTSAKSMVIELDIPNNISLLTINDLLSNINKYIAKDTKLVSSTKVNNELKEDEIICQVLIAEDKKQYKGV